MLKIMFVCTGNTCRSPLAEIFARQILKENHIHAEVISAGTSLMENDVTTWQHDVHVIAKERNLDTLNHHAQPVTIDLLEQMDLILAMDSFHLLIMRRMCPDELLEAFDHKAFLFRQYLEKLTEGDMNMNIPDPFGYGSARYRQVAKDIEHALAFLPGRLRESGLIS